MRQLRFGALTIAAIIAIGGAAYAWQAAQHRPVAGPITGSYDAGINGTFRIDDASGGGILSETSGGACIIFRAKDLGFTEMAKKHCTSDSDCAAPNENFYGYCHQPTNKCWSKPASADADGELCNRSIDYDPARLWPVNTPVAISDHPILVGTPGWHISKNAKARVLARLNCAGGSPCAPDGQNYVYDWGDPTQL